MSSSKVTEIYYGTLHDKQESIFLYCTVEEKVQTFCHVKALRPEVTDLFNISFGKGFHHTLNVTN